MSRYKKYTQEYRDEAVKMVFENDQPIAKVARDLGINEGTLGNCLCRIGPGCGNQERHAPRRTLVQRPDLQNGVVSIRSWSTSRYVTVASKSGAGAPHHGL